jgi:SulP family sulfate permease
LATGPVAVVSLLTASTLAPIATAGSQQYLMYAVLLALMVGIFQFALGVLRLGVVVNFISHPAVNGFTNAAALIIATSQLPKLLGIHVDKAPHHYETVWHIIKAAVHYTHWPSLGMGAAAFAIMYGLHRTAPIDFSVMIYFLPNVAIISLLGFMEAISVAKAIAAKTGQRLDPNRELIGQGLANIVGSVAKSYPVSGSFSRSAVSLQSGAVSSLSGVVTSLTVILVLVFLTPLFYHLPQAVLAAIIMFAVVGLLNINGFIHAWKAQWYDGVISVITFFSTLAFAPHLDRGILIGVGLSILLFLYKNTRPKVVDLSNETNCPLKTVCLVSHQPVGRED